MIESFSDKEFAAFRQAMNAPALWPLLLLAGETSIAEAVEACAARELPEEAWPAFGACAYTVEDLPHYEEVVRLILAVRLKLTWRPGKEPLQTAAKRVGVDVRTAQQALKTFERFGSRIESPAKLRGAAIR